MRLLDKLDAAVRAILLHPQDEHLGLLCSILHFLVVFISVFLLSRLGTLTHFLGLDVDRRNCLLDGHIERSLAELVEHEKVVG